MPIRYDSASNQHLLASESALWQTCWGAPPSFGSLSAALVNQYSTLLQRQCDPCFKDNVIQAPVLSLLTGHSLDSQGQWQQALQGEHLDVALLQGQRPLDGVHSH